MRRSDLPILGLVAGAVLLLSCGGGGITPIETAYNKGAYHYAQGNYASSIAEYEEAIAEDPEDLKARFNLGLAYEARGNQLIDAARSKARRLQRTSPEEAEALKREAEEAAAALRTKAREQYDAVLARVPDHPRATINVAALEWEADRHDEAERLLRAVIAADGNNLLARVALAANFIRAGRLDEARAELLTAKGVDDTHADINGLLGDLELRTDNLDAARDAYQTVIEKREAEDLHAILGMGEVELAAGNDEEAKSWMVRALLIHPRHWRAHAALAGIAEKRQKWELAIHHLWNARDLDFDRPEGSAEIDYDARLKRLYAELGKN